MRYGKKYRSDNGLRLDFNLESAKDRQNYVNKLVNEWITEGKTLREEDLTLLADYVLYGKDETQTSPVQRKEIEIETRYTTYQKRYPESLNSLLEDSTFNEAQVKPITKRNTYRAKKETFNREENSHILPLHQLWETIDLLAAKIDFFTGKKPLEDFSPELQAFLKKTPKPSPLNLHKMKHHLIEMRREQFTIRDSFCPSLMPHSTQFYEFDYDLDYVVNVLPMGLYTPKNPIFSFYLEKDLYFSLPPQVLRDFTYTPDPAPNYTIDLRNPDHLYQILRSYRELQTEALLDQTTLAADLINTIDFYCGAAQLSDEQRDILSLKLKHISNEQIRDIINKRYNKTHTANYISTIFKKNICDAIIAAVQLHYDSYLNRFDASAFKICNCCGRVKLKDTRNFVRKTRSSDGLSNRCKVCDKKERTKN